jgi:hypothetical protein
VNLVANVNAYGSNDKNVSDSALVGALVIVLDELFAGISTALGYTTTAYFYSNTSINSITKTSVNIAFTSNTESISNPVTNIADPKYYSSITPLSVSQTVNTPA